MNLSFCYNEKITFLIFWSYEVTVLRVILTNDINFTQYVRVSFHIFQCYLDKLYIHFLKKYESVRH